MSAFVVSDKHINALVSWAAFNRVSYYFGGSTRNIHGQEQETASTLLNENARSVNYRYRETGESSIKFRSMIAPLPSVVVLKLCSSFDYQACETDDYETTQAAAIIKAIRAAAIRKLPGYEDAPWTLD